jgi:hypothetical protein
MTGRPGLAGFAAVLAVFLGVRTAGAATVFNNINNSANPVCCGYAVGFYSPQNPTVFVDAYPFTVQGASYYLDTVGLLESIQNAIPAQGGLSLFVYADSAGVPGAVLESWQGIPVHPTITLDTASSVLHPILQQGQQYWFGVTTTNPTETAIWWINRLWCKVPGALVRTGAPSPVSPMPSVHSKFLVLRHPSLARWSS